MKLLSLNKDPEIKAIQSLASHVVPNTVSSERKVVETPTRIHCLSNVKIYLRKPKNSDSFNGLHQLRDIRLWNC